MAQKSKLKAKKGLGRGLSALLADDRPSVVMGSDQNAKKSANMLSDGKLGTADPSRRLLPIAFLERNIAQPRTRFDESAIDELAASIQEKGILQPILVRAVGGNRYQIVAGERRWRAAQKAGVHDVPVVVHDLNDAEVLEIAIIENIHRQDLTPIEEASGYRRLMQEFDHTQEAIAKIAAKSRSHIANLLRLLTLPEKIQMFVDRGDLSMGHARALIGASQPIPLARHIIEKGLSVRQAELLAQDAKGKKRTARPGGNQNKDADTLALEKDLSAALGMKVTIVHKGDSGTVAIQYDDLEALDSLCAKLGVCGI